MWPLGSYISNIPLTFTPMITCSTHGCVKRTGYNVGGGLPFIPMKVAEWLAGCSWADRCFLCPVSSISGPIDAGIGIPEYTADPSRSCAPHLLIHRLLARWWLFVHLSLRSPMLNKRAEESELYPLTDIFGASTVLQVDEWSLCFLNKSLGESIFGTNGKISGHLSETFTQSDFCLQPVESPLSGQ